MKTDKIIVGVDFSPEADLAARQAVEIARHTGAEVALVHCGDTIEMPELNERASPTSRAAFDVYRARLSQALAAHREQLSSLRQRLSGQGPSVSQALCEGFPDSALCDAAEEMGADLVVVGTHGRTGLRWFFLGSVAERVVHLCRADVLVARGENAGRGGYHRILVATDFSDSAERALDRALGLAASGAEVDVVHCYGVRWPAMVYAGGPMAPAPAPPDPVEQELFAAARARGEALVAGRRRAGLKIDFLALAGTPVPSIVHRLEERSYDLAALGGHGRRGRRRFALGSVAETVARRAPCSVLVARGGADDQG